MDAPKTKPATPQGGALLPEAFFLETRVRKVGTVKPPNPSQGRRSNRLCRGGHREVHLFQRASHMGGGGAMMPTQSRPWRDDHPPAGGPPH